MNETPISKAAFQLRLVCRHLQVWPISLWDSEYGCAKFVQLTADINADLLMRLRPNRCVKACASPLSRNRKTSKTWSKNEII